MLLDNGNVIMDIMVVNDDGISHIGMDSTDKAMVGMQHQMPINFTY
jgi:hypothetical protein